MKYPKNHLIIFCVITLVWSCTEKKDTLFEDEALNPLLVVDSTFHPGNDFFLFVNNNYQNQNAFDRSLIDRLKYENLIKMKVLLESSYKGDRPNAKTPKEKAGLFYYIGSDSLRAENQKTEPLNPVFNVIQKIRTQNDLQEYLIYENIHLGNLFFRITPNIEKKYLELIPVRFKVPDDSIKRNTLVNKINRLIKLSAIDVEEDFAKEFLQIENLLNDAKISPDSTAHFWSADSLNSLISSVDIPTYLQELNFSENEIYSKNPFFLERVDSVIISSDFNTLRSYCKIKAILAAGPYLFHELYKLSNDINKNSFAPRWIRVVEEVNELMSSTTGEMYVESYFSEEGKIYAEKMIDNILYSYAEKIKESGNISDSLKIKLLGQLSEIKVVAGYPDEQSEVEEIIVEGNYPTASFFNNVLLARYENFTSQINYLNSDEYSSGKVMISQDSEIVFEPETNLLIVPAGVLQYPFFSVESDPSLNYGGIGNWIVRNLEEKLYTYRFIVDSLDNNVPFSSVYDLIAYQSDLLQIEEENFVDSIYTETVLLNISSLEIGYNSFLRYLRTDGMEGMPNEQKFLMGWVALNNYNLDNGARTDYLQRILSVNHAVANMPIFKDLFDVNTEHKMYLPDSLQLKIW